MDQSSFQMHHQRLHRQRTRSILALYMHAQVNTCRPTFPGQSQSQRISIFEIRIVCWKSIVNAIRRYQHGKNSYIKQLRSTHLGIIPTMAPTMLGCMGTNQCTSHHLFSHLRRRMRRILGGDRAHTRRRPWSEVTTPPLLPWINQYHCIRGNSPSHLRQGCCRRLNLSGRSTVESHTPQCHLYISKHIGPRFRRPMIVYQRATMNLRLVLEA
jgi:hypothetical protein